MQRYVIQLISDIEVAITHAPPVSEYAGFPMFGFDDDPDDFAYSFAPQTMLLCDIFGLHAQAFPPEKRLNRSQITALLHAIERLWSAYNISYDMPYGLSARKRYTALTEKMETATINYSVDRGAEIDFCDDRKKCPFGENGVCTCREVERSVERDMAIWERVSEGEDDFDFSDLEDPMDEVRRWLNKGRDLPPWFFDDKHEKWQRFKGDNEQMEWLYFFRPDGGQDQSLYPYDLNDDSDFEDFDWEDERDWRKDDYDDDDMGLPF